MADYLEFKISSALKNIIGRDLITDDFIAVFELVKNSYDAYARRVQITFYDDKIIIADDGKGMSYDDLVNKWLFVGYSAKSDGTEDSDLKDIRSFRDKIKGKRYFAGAKGIGRFSADRLGTQLKLVTRKLRTKSVEQLNVNWDKFEEDPEKEFVEIKVRHSTLESQDVPELKHGTILEITGLTTEWPREKIQKLKYSLEKLINPFDSSEDPNLKRQPTFGIYIECLREIEQDKAEKFERDKVNGPVKNFVFETLKIKTTQILTTIEKESIETKLIDRGTVIYEIREPNDEFPLLEEVNFQLFFLNRKAKHNFSLQMGLQPKQFGSVFLFKNGFRVYPFGEEGDDSLGINLRRAQGYARFLGTRDLIGRIEIFSNTRDFVETSSRDGGLINTKAVDQLIAAFYEKCLKRLEKYIVDVQWAFKMDPDLKLDKDAENVAILDTVGSKARIARIIERLSQQPTVELVDYNKEFLSLSDEDVEVLLESSSDDDISAVFKPYKELARRTRDKAEFSEISALERYTRKQKKERDDAERKEREAREELERVQQELETERQKSTYLESTRKTLSEDAEGLIHGIKINTVKINASIESLMHKIREGILKEKDILRELTNIRFYSDRTLKVSKLITRANFRSDRERHTVDLAKYITQYLSIYSDIYDQSKLLFDVEDKGSSFHKKVSVLDLSLVLDNLISNSEKWRARKIHVSMSCRKNGPLKLLFSDDGVGLSKKFLSNAEQIFELGVTETDGSGIGLHTVRRLLRTMNGEIAFAGNNVDLKGAAFKIVFNR